jgi:outer membrane biosynthesis protein TonB
MIPRLLVPLNARPPAADMPSTRRRPTTLDERTLVPATLPIIPLNGHSSIPTSLPLEAIAARTVVPRDIDRAAFAIEVTADLPLQPTELDERITVPQGAAPPEVITPVENIPVDLVDPDVFMTGEVNLLTREAGGEERAKWEVIRNVTSVTFHILLLLAIVVAPKIFPPRPKTQEELDLARRQLTVLLPPGALEALEPPEVAPRPRERSEMMRVDPKVLRKVAPPEPKPTPGPKEPERVVKELPSAPVPQPNTTPPPAELNVPSAKLDAPKPPPPKLEKPEDQPVAKGLILPRNSAGGSIQDSLRDAAKMNAPRAIGGGGQLPGAPGGGGAAGQAYGAMEMLTPNQGVDFSNYLARVYQSVKRNWFAVMPVSVQLGDKGVVSLQFKIMRDGTVPDGDPRRVFGSGKDPLDRAAVSSIRASNPFEPLPSAFSGPYIELRFTYYYNIPPEFVH